MHGSSLYRWQSFAILTIFSTFLIHKATVAADSSQNESVVWNWPEVTVGPKATGVVHTYNTVDTLNASWTSNLDFSPFLVVWCKAPGGWTANQSGSVPSSGWHLVYLNLGIDAPYPLSCHLGFDNQTHIALSTPNGTSGTFNLTNAADSDPQTFGLSTSMAATSATATSTSTGAAAAVTTVVVNSTDSTSGGTIAGIVIAVVFGVAIVLGALIFLCLRKRRIDRRRRGATTGTASEDTETRAPDAQGFFAGEMAADHKYQSELPAEPKPVVEKDGMPQPAELPTEQVSEGPLEMEGSNTFLGRLRGMSLKN